MQALSGRLFGPGLAPAGLIAPATLDALQLGVTLPDGARLSAPLSQLTLRGAGFDSRHVEISWTRDGQRWALMIDDAATIDALRRNPPAGLRDAVDQLGRQSRQASTRRALGLSAVAVWLGLPVLAIGALLLAAKPLAGWVAGLIPLAQEVRLGDELFALQAPRLQLIGNTAANRAVQAIGDALTQGSRYRYRWHIARDATLNAFAVPGGIVVVHSGLILAADDADELAGVIAHEIEHVEQRHSLKAMMQQAGLRLAITAGVGDFGMLGNVAGHLSGLSFSRDNERDADLQGLRRLRAAGFDAQGMLRLLAKLGAQSGGADVPTWQSSHPSTPERLARLAEAIDATSVSASAVHPHIAWPAVQDSLRE